MVLNSLRRRLYILRTMENGQGGRSAAYFGFKSKTTGRKFTVFLKDFEEGFAHEMVKGEVKGLFTFCKRGSNYGTARIKESS